MLYCNNKLLIPLQRQGSNLGCVNIRGDENQQVQTFRESARPGRPASASLCLVHREDRPKGPKVCELGPEPSGTPIWTKSSPNGSP